MVLEKHFVFEQEARCAFRRRIADAAIVSGFIFEIGDDLAVDSGANVVLLLIETVRLIRLAEVALDFKARFEMTFQNKFDAVLVNADLVQSQKEAQRLYDEFKKK